MCHPIMLLHCLREDEDVIQVDTDYTLRDQILEYLVHHGLESGWAVGETKEHDQGFENSSVCAESGLPLITFLDADVVVSPSDIKLGEVARTPESVNEVRDEQKRICILYHLCIQCPVVLDQSETSILLLDEEYRSCHWGLGGTNPTRCQILLNEGVQFSLLVQRLWVHLGEGCLC